jgi:hypothetical protein
MEKAASSKTTIKVELEHDCGGGSNSAVRVTVDAKVLKCPVCFPPLKPPEFQVCLVNRNISCCHL